MQLILLHDFLYCLSGDEFVHLDLHEDDPLCDMFPREFYQVRGLLSYPPYVHLKRKVVTSVHASIPEGHLIIGLSLSSIERNYADSPKEYAYCGNDSDCLFGTGSCDLGYEDEILKFWLE